jgi:hypothetical protein
MCSWWNILAATVVNISLQQTVLLQWDIEVFIYKVWVGSGFPSNATLFWIFYSVTATCFGRIFPLEDGHTTKTCSGYYIKYSKQFCVRWNPEPDLVHATGCKQPTLKKKVWVFCLSHLNHYHSILHYVVLFNIQMMQSYTVFGISGWLVCDCDCLFLLVP